MTRPALAYVVNALNPGGTEKLVVEMARVFAREYDLSAKLGRPVYMIGMIRSGEGITLARGEAEVELADYGWDHFQR
jgi:hypothetical protein